MAQLLSFSRPDDRDIEVCNLCLEYGCAECSGYDDDITGVLTICLHGCHVIEVSAKARVPLELDANRKA